MKLETMNLDEWKKNKIHELEEIYNFLKQFNVKIVLDDFWDRWNVGISNETFPYDMATDIRAQLEGTGDSVYDLSFWCWIGPLRAHKSFRIKTERGNQQMVSLLKSTKSSTKQKIIETLENYLQKFQDRREKSLDNFYKKPEDKEWARNNPYELRKINYVKYAIQTLKSEKG